MKRRIEKFVIVTPRAVSPAGTLPRIHPPLGAISVLAEAKRNGYEALLFDTAAEGLKKGIIDSSYNPVAIEELDGIPYWKTGLCVEEIVTKLVKLEPDVIGMSCCTVVDRGEVAKTAKALQEAFSTTPIILGGHEASQWYEEILGNTPFPIGEIPAIDYVVVGPGQPVITSLLRYLAEPAMGNLPQGVARRFNGRVEFYERNNFQKKCYPQPCYH